MELKNLNKESIVSIDEITKKTVGGFLIRGIGSLLIPFVLWLTYCWFCNKYSTPQFFSFSDFIIATTALLLLQNTGYSPTQAGTVDVASDDPNQLISNVKKYVTQAYMALAIKWIVSPLVGLGAIYLLFTFTK